jgi:hypothetical protein
MIPLNSATASSIVCPEKRRVQGGESSSAPPGQSPKGEADDLIAFFGLLPESVIREDY